MGVRMACDTEQADAKIEVARCRKAAYCNAANEPDEREEIEVTPEMIAAGETELAVICDPFSPVSEVAGFHLSAVYGEDL
jgi:hypothetical protein